MTEIASLPLPLVYSQQILLLPKAVLLVIFVYLRNHFPFVSTTVPSSRFCRDGVASSNGLKFSVFQFN